MMPPLRPEHEFLRYRDLGDVAALGAVFDAVAPELLQVAVRLAGANAAEDLLQSTFVDAIEHAARWDARRPLTPWLCGILANHARELRRRTGRALASARLPERAATAPDDAAAATEVTAADARDRALPMMHLTGGSIGEEPYVAYRPGLTSVHLVSDEAAYAVVRRRGQEYARVRLQLATDAVNLIRL